ncbi:MAG: hypothetical protein JWQ11_4923, partial [Rhizobacter sp.]|nr:hypothetical protein [Rhizobacter sp.]
MRLLQRSDTGEFSLYTFGDNKIIPPYAILSHTWGADTEEVTFEDLVNGTGENKLGNVKIRFCGEQARKDGLQHFWIDTCCIDKNNEVELSHAINSMFRWYRNATRCYVYLSDVPTKKRERDESSKDTWESVFRSSRWFTRGWTLQELIAPPSVEFFSRTCERLGDRNSLIQQIYDITRISKSALNGVPLYHFTVKERLSWIDSRKTKVEEDKAYSLLGIFDVNLQLRYGEGMPNAFKRLEEEIDKLGKCIKDLRLTNPRDDKKRIEDIKGGLLEDSYHWILQNSDFQQWRDGKSCLLWMKGDPGKGKTMLLCGIIDDLARSKININLSYFFCQATDSRINNATAVLRGLVYLLVYQQPSLISHVMKEHDLAGKTLFEDMNAWVASSNILMAILQDPNLNNTYLVIDALDECETDLPRLLRLIVQSTSICPRVKWIVSSRNKPQIEVELRPNDAQRLSLELNAEHVSRAVELYINYKVSQLVSIKHEPALQEKVQNEMHRKANGTFLWVALVFQELERVESWYILDVLEEIPAGLQRLYDRMMRQVQKLERRDPEFCRLVLSTTTLAYSPLHLLELGTLSGLPRQISNNVDYIMKIIGNCGSFLTIREGYVYFVHQSAKDYLDSKDLSLAIFHSGRATFHYDLFSRSIQVMSKTLQQDMYKLNLPGILIELVKVPNPDPLAPLRYPCVSWARHFQEAFRGSVLYQSDLTDRGTIYQFFQNYFLYWLEAVSLMGK